MRKKVFLRITHYSLPPVFLPGFLSCCLTNRGCEITVSHDTKQGEDGGTITETITYDQATGTLSGSPTSSTDRVLQA